MGEKYIYSCIDRYLIMLVFKFNSYPNTYIYTYITILNLYIIHVTTIKLLSSYFNQFENIHVHRYMKKKNVFADVKKKSTIFQYGTMSTEQPINKMFKS